VTLGIGTDMLDRILPITEELSLRVLADEPDKFVRETMVLPLLEEATGIRVDIVFSFTPYEHEAIQRAKLVRIDDTQICFVSVEDLIIHKIFAGRARDIDDIRSIILKNPGFNSSYVLRWLQEFDTTFPEGDFVNRFNNILSDK